MKILLQYSQSNPQDWFETDSSRWASLPGKPQPVGNDTIDDAPGWVTRLNCQGVEFVGYDHYAVEDLPDGWCRVTVWKDDPDDLATDSLGEFYARVVTFGPLAPDPRMGGAWNTRQSQVVYAGPKLSAFYEANPTQNTEVRPWTDFVPPSPSLIRHGIWMPDILMTEHDTQLTKRGWREWVERVPTEQIGTGRLKSQRPQGLYLKPLGTLTFYQQDVDTLTGVHVATHEDQLLIDTPDNGPTESITLAGAEDEFGWTFSTDSNQPNNAAWPTGNYRCQLDVSAAGADITFGLRTAGALSGHFARVASDLSADLETKAQTETLFSGTGLKLATTGSVSWTAGAAGDRFECAVVATRPASHGNQTLDLVFDADGFTDGPWPVVITETPSATFSLTPSISDSAVMLDRVAVRIFGDEFNRANSQSLGASWREDEGDADMFLIGANEADLCDIGTTGAEVPGIAFVNVSVGDDQQAGFVVRSATQPIGVTTVKGGLFVRGSGSRTSFTGYTLEYDLIAQRLLLNRYAAGTVVFGPATQLGSYNVVLVNGDVLRLRADGTRLTATLNGVPVIRVTDTNISSGEVGLCGGVDQTDTFAALFAVDDFSAGEVVIGVSVTDAFPPVIYTESPSVSFSLSPSSRQVFTETPSTTIFVSDEFSRPDATGGQSIGSDWTVSENVVGNASIQARKLLLLDQAMGRFRTGVFSADQRASMRIGAILTIDETGPAVRLSGTQSSLSGYAVLFSLGTPVLLLKKFVNQSASGGGTTLRSLGISLAANDRVDIEAVGNVIRVFRNGQRVMEATDGDVASGDPGWLASGVTQEVTQEWDDFVAINVPEVTDILPGREVWNEVPTASSVLLPTSTDSLGVGQVFTETPSVTFILATAELDTAVLIEAQSLSAVLAPESTDSFPAQVFTETPSLSFILVSAESDVFTSVSASDVTVTLTSTATESLGGVISETVSVTLILASTTTDFAVEVDDVSTTAVLPPQAVETEIVIEAVTVTPVFVLTDSDLLAAGESNQSAVVFDPSSSDAVVSAGITETPSTSFRLFTVRYKSPIP